MVRSQIALAAALLFLASPAFAQSGPSASSTSVVSSDEDASDNPGTGDDIMGGGMMGGDMMGSGMMGGDMMGSGMMGRGMWRSGDGVHGYRHGMMGMHRAMAAGRIAAYVAGQLAYLKTALNLTDAQEPKWKAFAETIAGNAKAMIAMYKSMMGAGAPATAHDRLARRQEFLAARLDALKKTTAALDALYAVLTPEQKEMIDNMRLGPLGVPMGM